VSDPAEAAPSGGRPAWPRWFWPLFGAALVACMLPFALAPMLPMCDVNGSAGIVGALLHRADPATHVNDYFTFNVHASPNALYWAWSYALGHVMSVSAATNLFVALFCIAGVPLAFLFALRTTGRPPWLAFLALAAVFHRCLWYGFVGSVAAVGLLFLEIGLMNVAFARARPSWADAALAATLFLLSTAHAFLFLAGAGFWLLYVALAARQPSPLWRRLAVGLPALVYLGPWLGPTFVGGQGPGMSNMVAHLWAQRAPLPTYLENVHEWFLDAYTSSVDEVVAVVFAVTLAAALVFGVRPLAGERETGPLSPLTKAGAPDRLWRLRLPLTSLALALGYLLLPMSIDRPFGWWAVNVRLLVPFLLSLGLLVRVRARGLPAWVFTPVCGAAIFYGLFIAHDFRRWWMGVELDGFREALASIPEGKKVHALWPAFEGERHYSHFPMAHLVDWYIVERGGLATPAMTSVPKELWASPKPVPATPWSLERYFTWDYGRHWDYFLAKLPAPGNGGMYHPFSGSAPGTVTKVFEKGLWQVWRRDR
jgi:hypothetical protein